jgi:GDP-L-fucose synthase
MSEPSPQHWQGRAVTVTGGAGFFGKALVGRLESLGATVRIVRSAEHDLRDADACREALSGADTVFHLAANVGGIGFNRRNPAPLAYDNLIMGANVFEQSRLEEVRKLVCASSVCAYPKHTPVPFSEDNIWNGYPEESNAPYGLAKKMLLVLSDAYRRQYGFDSCAPVMANLYGPNDNFDLEDSHVIAALVRKFAEAVERGEDEVVVWGTGTPTREFLHIDDAARALLLAGERLDTSEVVNIGTGLPTAISELAEMVKSISGFEGRIRWDDTMPDGQPERYLDVSRARELTGFEASVPLEQGLLETFEWYRDHAAAPESSVPLSG